MAKTDPFVAMTECHFMNEQSMAEMSYYPQFQRWWGSVDGIMRVWAGRSLAGGGDMPHPHAHALIEWMDKAGVDVCFALRESMMDVADYTTCMSTNGFILTEIAPYPERMYLEANCGPVIRRGVKNAIWELEHLFKTGNARLCKVYQPEDDGPLNDPRMWPFYEKAQELGVPLTIHTGMAYVPPQPGRHTHPAQLDDILLDFPDLKIIAYHMGWPYHEELFGLAAKHPNLYISISGIVGWFARAPQKGWHMIGEALEWATEDKLVLGFDLPFDDMPKVVDYVRNFDIPKDVREGWGYPEITDLTRAKILGLNLAKLTGLEPTKRVVGKK
jgi:predicted TIM-barrel fold metal-dependent hydrolase